MGRDLGRRNESLAHTDDPTRITPALDQLGRDAAKIQGKRAGIQPNSVTTTVNRILPI